MTDNYAGDSTISVTDSNMRLLWVHGSEGVAGLLQTLGAAVLAVEEEVIDLFFNVDDNGEVAVGVYLERER